MSENIENSVAQINFQDIGQGKVIVLLHGFIESLKIWDEFADKLSTEHRVISIDLPGHGLSSTLGDKHSMEKMAIEVKNILEILGVNKVILVGHSMGGYVSMAFADLYPKLLAGLVLFHSHAAADDIEARKNRDRMIKVIENDHIGFIKEFIPDLFAPCNVERCRKEIDSHIQIAKKTSKEGIIAALRGMKDRKDRVSVFNELEIPTLVIAGKEDKRIPVQKLVEQVNNPEYSMLTILENVGHMGFIEEKEESFQILKDFVESIY